MFCKYCGNEISDDSVFCSRCGKNIVGDISGKTTGTENAEVKETPAEEEKQEIGQWYYLDGMKEEGPLSTDMIRRKMINGLISRYAKIKRGVDGSWILISESEFRDLVQESESKSISISDIWVWCLAIIPIVSIAALTYFHVLPAESNLVWVVSIGLNVLFLILDRKKLEKDGFHPESWMWLGFVLVPVYLFVRELKTNRNFVPVIIWCFLFAVDVFVL